MLLSKSIVTFVAGWVLTFSGLIGADEAVTKDRQLYAGTWRITSLETDGIKVSEDEAKTITVINKEDGTWTLVVEGKVASRGTSKIDPTRKPKTIDLTETEGEQKGQTILGIYEVEKDSRKLCISKSGQKRPAEFSAKRGSGHTLIFFKPVKK
jgi:uncharacterized protein (TIGR03067 family)